MESSLSPKNQELVKKLGRDARQKHDVTLDQIVMHVLTGTPLLSNNPRVHYDNKAGILLQPLMNYIQELEEKAFQHDQMRATLLVNFLEDSPHNSFGFGIQDPEGNRATHSMLIEVLEHLTKKGKK